MSLTFGGKTAQDFAREVDHVTEAGKLWEQGVQLVAKIADLERDLMDYKDWLDANGADDRYVERRQFWKEECERKYRLVEHLGTLAEQFDREAVQCGRDELDTIHSYAWHGGRGMLQCMSDAVPSWVTTTDHAYPSEGLLFEPAF
jgi:hypothetical protein